MRTPDHPSLVSIRRVKNPLPVPHACRYCGAAVTWVHHAHVYGATHGKWPYVYRCTGCGAYVGMHPFTNVPLGTLANEELRRWRGRVKTEFNKLWLPDRARRDDAYAWLADRMGIPAEKCHFGWFDLAECQLASVHINERIHHGTTIE